jgi:hypothetical protein
MLPDQAMNQCTMISRRYTDRFGKRHYGCMCPAVRYYSVDPSLSYAERGIIVARIHDTQHFDTLEQEHLIANYTNGSVLISRCKKHPLSNDLLDMFGLRPITSSEALAYHILTI